MPQNNYSNGVSVTHWIHRSTPRIVSNYSIKLPLQLVPPASRDTRVLAMSKPCRVEYVPARIVLCWGTTSSCSRRRKLRPHAALLAWPWCPRYTSATASKTHSQQSLPHTQIIDKKTPWTQGSNPPRNILTASLFSPFYFDLQILRQRIQVSENQGSDNLSWKRKLKLILKFLDSATWILRNLITKFKYEQTWGKSRERKRGLFSKLIHKRQTKNY